MKKKIIMLSGVLLLAACSPAQIAATATARAFSAETVEKLTTICRRGEAAVALASHPAMPASVKEIAVFVGAYCGQLLAGAVPPTTDANTVGWLESNLTGLRALLGR